MKKQDIKYIKQQLTDEQRLEREEHAKGVNEHRYAKRRDKMTHLQKVLRENKGRER